MKYLIYFPKGLSDEEKQLKKKYSKLQELKSYLKDQEEAKVLKPEWSREPNKPTLPPGVSAKEVAMKLIRSGKIKIPAKSQNLYEREKLKPIRRSWSHIQDKKSSTCFTKNEHGGSSHSNLQGRDEGLTESRTDRMYPTTFDKNRKHQTDSPGFSDEEEKQQLKRFKGGTTTRTYFPGKNHYSEEYDDNEEEKRRRYSNKFDRFSNV